jgi:transposase
LIDQLKQKIKDLGKEMRLMQSMPGIGPISAIAIEAFAPELSRFERGRDFVTWLRLTPRQHSTGGKQRLGRTSKMGQRDIRWLLVMGAMSRISHLRRYQRAAGPWLQDKLSRKHKIVAAIALANKMARQIWAMLNRDEPYKMPAYVWV